MATIAISMPEEMYQRYLVLKAQFDKKLREGLKTTHAGFLEALLDSYEKVADLEKKLDQAEKAAKFYGLRLTGVSKEEALRRITE